MTSGGAIGKALRRLRGAPPPAAPDPVKPFAATMSEREREIAATTLEYSITSQERIVAVLDAVRYCEARGIPGAFAECGVWRGGSVMAMIYALQDVGGDDRDIWLYDTFEGMTEPTEHDTSRVDRSAKEWWRAAEERGTGRAFPQFFNPDVFNEEMVRENLRATGYPDERLHFVRGRVEETLPAQMPDRIALLRLDTDWYESTRHELDHLYPRLVEGGVLIVDDYGHWDGARRAVDEYFAEKGAPLLLSRIDYTGRIAIKH